MGPIRRALPGREEVGNVRTRILAVFCLVLAFSAVCHAQGTIPLIGDKAPAFKAMTTQGEIDFPDQYKGKWVILFSHPGDFTPVCTTEFMMFASMYPKFQAANCELLGLSVDSNPSHIAWLREIADKIEYKGLKNVQVQFPIIADNMGQIAQLFGMLQPSASATKTVRAVFFIDPTGIVRALIYYPLSNGRNIDEIYRILIAMQTSEAEKVATPANWQPGDDVIVPAPGTMAGVGKRLDGSDASGGKCVDWFLCFKKLTPQ